MMGMFVRLEMSVEKADALPAVFWSAPMRGPVRREFVTLKEVAQLSRSRMAQHVTTVMPVQPTTVVDLALVWANVCMTPSWIWKRMMLFFMGTTRQAFGGRAQVLEPASRLVGSGRVVGVAPEAAIEHLLGGFLIESGGSPQSSSLP